MKLADYLFENNVTPTQLRSMLGIKHRSTVWRYLTNGRIPQPQMIQKIERLTDGQVRLEDYLDPSPPNCAEIIPLPDGTTKMILPWSQEYDHDPHLGDPTGETARISQPLKRALVVLDGRGWFTPSGTWLLDGRISDVKGVVRAANAVLRARGEATIPYPGVEGPDEPA